MTIQMLIQESMHLRILKVGVFMITSMNMILLESQLHLVMEQGTIICIMQMASIQKNQGLKN